MIFEDNKIYEFKFIKYLSYHSFNYLALVSHENTIYKVKKLQSSNSKIGDSVYCTFRKYNSVGDPLLYEIEFSYKFDKIYKFEFFKKISDSIIIVYSSDKSDTYAVSINKKFNKVEGKLIECYFKGIYKGFPTFKLSKLSYNDSQEIHELIYIKDDNEYDYLGIGQNKIGDEVKYLKCSVKDKIKKGDKVICSRSEKGFKQQPVNFEKENEYNFTYLEHYNNKHILCKDDYGNTYNIQINYSLLKTLRKGDEIICLFDYYYNGSATFKLKFYPLLINDIIKDKSKEKFLDNYLGNGYDLYNQYKNQLKEGNNMWILSLTNYLDKNITGLLSRGLNKDAIKCIEIYESMYKFIKSAKDSGLGSFTRISEYIESNSPKFNRLLNLKIFLESNEIDDFFEINKLINIQNEFNTFFHETGFNIFDRSEILEILNNVKGSDKIDEFGVLIKGCRSKILNYYSLIISEHSRILFLNKNQNDSWLKNNLDEIDLKIIDFIYEFDGTNLFFRQLHIFINAIISRNVQSCLKAVGQLNEFIDYNFDPNQTIEKGFNLSFIIEIKEGMYYSKVDDFILYINAPDQELIKSAIKRGKSITCKTISSFEKYKFVSIDAIYSESFKEFEFDCTPSVIKLEKYELGLLNKSIYYTYNIFDSIRFDLENVKDMLHFLSNISGWFLRSPKSYAYKILDNADFKLKMVEKFGEKFNFETFENILEDTNKQSLEKFPQLEILVNQLHMMRYINSDKNKDLIDIIKTPDTIDKDLHRKILIYNIIGDTDIGISKEEILSNILSNFSGLEKNYQTNVFDNQTEKLNFISESETRNNNIIQQIFDGNYKESMELEFKETLICPVPNKNQLFEINKITNNHSLDQEQKNFSINKILFNNKTDNLSKRIITHHTFRNISGMLNTSGGQIIIGIRDLHPDLRINNDFEYPGLFEDYKIVKGGWDELLLYFDDYFKNYVIDYNTFLPFVKPELQEFNNKKFMIINVGIPYGIDKLCIIKDPSDNNKEKAFERGFASASEMTIGSIQSFKRQVTTKEGPHNVYIVRNDKDQYKIGRTQNFKSRLSGLRTANPSIEEFYIKTYKTKQIAHDLEQYLLNRYKPNKIERDWFHLNDNQLNDCKTFMDNQFKIFGFNSNNEINFSDYQ